jgi:hypothetical protein
MHPGDWHFHGEDRRTRSWQLRCHAHRRWDRKMRDKTNEYETEGGTNRGFDKAEAAERERLPGCKGILRDRGCEEVRWCRASGAGRMMEAYMRWNGLDPHQWEGRVTCRRRFEDKVEGRVEKRERVQGTREGENAECEEVRWCGAGCMDDEDTFEMSLS